MRWFPVIVALIGVLVTAPVPPAAADAYGGDCWGTPSLGEMEISDGTAAHTFYIDDRDYVLGSGTWIYEESNGVFTPHAAVNPPSSVQVPYWWQWVFATMPNGAPQDLQRGGSSPYVPGDSDICTDPCTCQPDTLIF